MTFSVGTKVKISPISRYYSQGLDDSGEQLIGEVLSNSSCKDWPKAFIKFGWDVKVQWPKDQPGSWKLYSSQQDLIMAQRSNRSLGDFL